MIFGLDKSFVQVFILGGKQNIFWLLLNDCLGELLNDILVEEFDVLELDLALRLQGISPLWLSINLGEWLG